MIATNEEFDVVIIGGGPAGLSCAIWCVDLGLSSILIEEDAEIGGNLQNIYNPISNYPGLATANGREMSELLLVHVKRSGTIFRTRCRAIRVDPAAKTVELADGTLLHSHTFVFATGVSRRKLGIEGEKTFEGRGVLNSGSTSSDLVAGRTVAIVGGGDAAMENAVMLSKTASKVYVIHRGERLSARSEFVDIVTSDPNVTILLERNVTSINGSASIESIDVESIADQQIVTIPIDYLLIRIGVEPNGDLFRGLIDTDRGGYALINSRCETSVPGLYAIGDVANPAAPTISSAVGHGATAAKVIRSLLPN